MTKNVIICLIAHRMSNLLFKYQQYDRMSIIFPEYTLMAEQAKNAHDHLKAVLENEYGVHLDYSEARYGYMAPQLFWLTPEEFEIYTAIIEK